MRHTNLAVGQTGTVRPDTDFLAVGQTGTVRPGTDFLAVGQTGTVRTDTNFLPYFHASYHGRSRTQ